MNSRRIPDRGIFIETQIHSRSLEFFTKLLIGINLSTRLVVWLINYWWIQIMFINILKVYQWIHSFEFHQFNSPHVLVVLGLCETCEVLIDLGAPSDQQVDCNGAEEHGVKTLRVDCMDLHRGILEAHDSG